MNEDRIEVDGIPANLYSAGGESGLLLLGHGGGHGKDGPRFVRLCRQYAVETGLAVVCMDAVDHGERATLSPSTEAAIPPRWHSNAVDRMIGDWQKITASLAPIGPAVAYAGFSMGTIFGFPIVAAMPSIRAAVFVAGGIPNAGGIDDPPLRSVLLNAASRLGGTPVLMLNKRADEIFSAEDTSVLFDAIPGDHNRLAFSEGDHDDWPPNLIRDSIDFIQQHLGGAPAGHGHP